MTPYSASTLERLASELEAADKEMTPGPWGVLPEQFDPWHVNAPSRDVCALPYDHRPDERAADAHSICNLRNSAPEVAAALRAAVAEVARLQTKSEALAKRYVEADVRIEKIGAERDSLRDAGAALEALVEEACDSLDTEGLSETADRIRAAAKEAK